MGYSAHGSEMYSGYPPLGKHLIADFYGAGSLIDPAPAQDVLIHAAKAAGAVLLDVKLHDFGSRAGFTGVALLAESHISIHTWPECGFATIDIFMCGNANPHLGLDVLQAYFAPEKVDLQVITRGVKLQLPVDPAVATS